MDPQQPADDGSKNQSNLQSTASASSGDHIQSNNSRRPANLKEQMRPRTKLIIAGSVLIVTALIGTAINASISVCRKGQEQFDDDSHPLRALGDSIITSLTCAGKDKELTKAVLELLSAETARARGDYVKAHASFERLCTLYNVAIPNSYTNASMLAIVAGFEYQFHKYKEAESKFREAVKVFKQTDPNMHPFASERWLAYTLIAENKQKESLDLSNQIVAEAKEVDRSHMGNAAHVLPALILLAYVQKAADQNANAVETYKSILSIMDKQDDKPTPRRYAEIFVDMGDAQDDNDKKLASFNQAISIDPIYSRAYQFRASLFETLNKTQDALGDLNRCIELDPKNTWSYKRRATIFQGLHDYAAELKDLNRCIELKPKVAWHYASRGYVFKQMKLFDKSIADYSEALRLRPSYDYTRYERGLLYKDLKQYEQAVQDLTTVIQNQINKKPDSLDSWLFKHAYLERANVHDDMAKPDLAQADRKLAAQIKLPATSSEEP